MDNTKSGTIADSYASVEQADDYALTIYGQGYNWSSLSEGDKEAALITATRTIDQLQIKYPRTVYGQALKFPVDPRGATDQEGRPLDDGFNKATEATIIQALFIVTYADELQEAKGNAIQGIQSEQVGTAIARTMTGYNPVMALSSEALNTLAPYVYMRSGLRVVR